MQDTHGEDIKFARIKEEESFDTLLLNTKFGQNTKNPSIE